MIAKVCYKHTEGDYSAVNSYRKSEADEVVVYFFPEGEETLPFPNGESMIPFNAFVEWFNERTAAANMLTDEQAATIPTLYPLWFAGEKVKANDRRLYEERLYKCIQEHTTQADWTPDKTPSLWVVLDVAHAGTLDDPIPAARGMEYEYGLYYFDSEDGNIYLCKRLNETGTIVLHYMPHELVGQYFELVEVVE